MVSALSETKYRSSLRLYSFNTMFIRMDFDVYVEGGKSHHPHKSINSLFVHKQEQTDTILISIHFSRQAASKSQKFGHVLYISVQYLPTLAFAVVISQWDTYFFELYCFFCVM